MNSALDDVAYTVSEEDGKFLVRDPVSRTIMVCGDRASADHYASMLNAAYRQGYKAAVREGKE